VLYLFGGKEKAGCSFVVLCGGRVGDIESGGESSGTVIANVDILIYHVYF